MVRVANILMLNRLISHELISDHQKGTIREYSSTFFQPLAKKKKKENNEKFLHALKMPELQHIKCYIYPMTSKTKKTRST